MSHYRHQVGHDPLQDIEEQRNAPKRYEERFDPVGERAFSGHARTVKQRQQDYCRTKRHQEKQ
jgi:hypothetical protein